MSAAAPASSAASRLSRLSLHGGNGAADRDGDARMADDDVDAAAVGAGGDDDWRTRYLDRWGDAAALRAMLLGIGVDVSGADVSVVVGPGGQMGPPPDADMAGDDDGDDDDDAGDDGDGGVWRALFEARAAAEAAVAEQHVRAHAEQTYGAGFAALERFRQTGADDALCAAASAFLRVLTDHPWHVSSLANLAFLAFTLHGDDEALALLDIAEAVLAAGSGDDEERADAAACARMRAEIRAAGVSSGGGSVLSADRQGLSASATRALKGAFRRFDADGDGALSQPELLALVTAVNGAAPPDGAAELYVFLTGNFRCTVPGGLLTRAGFLDFYTFQTLQSPAETAQDLAALGCPGFSAPSS